MNSKKWSARFAALILVGLCMQSESRAMVYHTIKLQAYALPNGIAFLARGENGKVVSDKTVGITLGTDGDLLEFRSNPSLACGVDKDAYGLVPVCVIVIGGRDAESDARQFFLLPEIGDEVATAAFTGLGPDAKLIDDDVGGLDTTVNGKGTIFITLDSSSFIDTVNDWVLPLMDQNPELHSNIHPDERSKELTIKIKPSF